MQLLYKLFYSVGWGEADNDLGAVSSRTSKITAHTSPFAPKLAKIHKLFYIFYTSFNYSLLLKL